MQTSLTRSLVLGVLAAIGCTDPASESTDARAVAPLSKPPSSNLPTQFPRQTRRSVCFYGRDQTMGLLPGQCPISGTATSETCGNIVWPSQKAGGYQATQNIPLWLTQTWERVANVRFTYGGYTWDQPGASVQSAIVCANDGHSLIGKEDVKVLLTVAAGGGFGTGGGNTAMDRTTSMHEFGHALGFQHEHDRADRPSDMNCAAPCGVGQSCPLAQCPGVNGSAGWPDGNPTTGVGGGPFDKNSIMSYQLCGRNSNNSSCWTPNGVLYWNRDQYGNEMRNRSQNDGFLSPGDVAAVRSVYGKNGVDYSVAQYGCLRANNALSTSGDADCDGVFDIHDDCPWAYNPGQEESLNDGVGDACSDPNAAPFDTGPPGVYDAQHRLVKLHVTDNWSMGWASVEYGAPGDRVWLDQVWDGEKNQSPAAGATWVTNTAWARIASGSSTRTRMRSLNMPAGQAVVDPVRGGYGKLRACASNAATPGAITCTQWYGEDPAFAQTDQIAQYETVTGTGGTRFVLLHVSPADGTAWASIQGPLAAGDEVYLNRYDWDYNRPAPADVTVLAGVTTFRTPMRFIRAHSTYQGWVQACAKVVGNATPVCTGWYGPV